MTTQGGHTIQTAGSSNFGSSILHKRRGSDRSLTGSTHELMVNARVAHSHSQSNITEIPYRLDDYCSAVFNYFVFIRLNCKCYEIFLRNVINFIVKNSNKEIHPI